MKYAVLLLLALLPGLAAAAPQHHLLIVAGIGGLDEYREQFEQQSLKLYRAALEAGIEPARIVLLSASPLQALSLEHQPSTRENLARALARVREDAAAGDRVFIVFFGHGNPRGDSAVVNLPGPDLSAGDLAEMLQGFEQQVLTIVNTASASGPFANRLSAANRIVITATSSGREYYTGLFGDYFADAFAGNGADRDKDGMISLLEAFDYARREVRRSYEAEKRLLTEHALLDDNGDGVASLEPGEFEADGALAHRVHLQPPWTPSGAAAAAMLEMLERKRQIEASISALKMQRDSLPRDSYYDKLELLLVDLALLAREIRAQGG